jgi:hypothetical protein
VISTLSLRKKKNVEDQSLEHIINKSTFTTSTLKLRDLITNSSECVRANFQPSSFDYYVQRDFEKVNE